MSPITAVRSPHPCVGGADHEGSAGRFSGVIDTVTSEVTARLGVPQNT